jgi:hypothetical protein
MCALPLKADILSVGIVIAMVSFACSYLMTETLRSGLQHVSLHPIPVE